MTPKVPYSPFTTRLSGSAKETELRIRSIFQWKKKRPPIIAFVAAILVIALCGSLVGFTVVKPEEPPVDEPIAEVSPPANEPAPEHTDTKLESTSTPPEIIDTDKAPDLGLPDVIELSTSDGKTYPAQRYDGDGWYIYIPEGWYKENVWDQWNSQYGTDAHLNVQYCSDRMEDIKAYYGVLGAWPYDTDMDAPYDYYYLLIPSARDTIRQELFFVPVSETSSYALTCTWVKASQRDGEYDLLHAMAASFAVDERVQPATREDPSVVLDLSQEPPLSESDLALAVPDFLTEEQQLLYRKARNLYEHAFGADTWFIEYPETMNGPFAEYETLERNDHIYTRSQGRYSDWTLFDTVIHSVFTVSFFQSKNTENLYVEHDGCLYFVNVARGCGYYYNDNFPDEFRLIEQTATSIKFAVIGHYSEAWPKDDETTEERNRRLEREYEYTWEFPISMVLTEDGWRFDEFYSPLTDEISSDAIA